MHPRAFSDVECGQLCHWIKCHVSVLIPETWGSLLEDYCLQLCLVDDDVIALELPSRANHISHILGS